MIKRNLKRDNSGQVLVITSLLVTLLLLSTAIYVIETEKEIPTIGNNNNPFLAYKQSARNTLISALANVTSGGESAVLTTDLNKLKETITSHSYQAILEMDFTLLNSAPYQEGFWISWGTDGRGVSSTYVSFVFDSSSSSTTSNLEYAVNVTSDVSLSGEYRHLNDTSKQVNLIANVFNEGKPASANSLTFYFDFDGSLLTEDWVKVDSPNITNFGTGTYSVAFFAETDRPSDPIIVSMYCQDQRGILVGADLTCTSIG
jgi:hypothetical protein